MPQRKPLEDLVIRPKTVEVQAEKTPHKTYDVTLPHCTCPDFQFRDTTDEPFLCKHILGVYKAMHGWRAPNRPIIVLTEEVQAVLDQHPGITAQLAEIIAAGRDAS